ncbi:MAG: DMT family transporter, partial [Muribaculaceae bacterium]|nr:DMT family transporter [Muribaculaceae bacterium]
MNSVKIKGYILGFIAAATYGLNPLFALPLLADGMDTSSILFFRYMLAIPILAIMMLVRRRRFAVSKGTMGLMAAFGILVGLSSITLFESYRHMQAGIASTILFVYPLMVAVIMAAVYRERITP